MWIAISLMMIAVSFLVLVIFLIISLLKWNRAVESIEKTVRQVEQQLSETLQESRSMMQEVRMLVADVREKTDWIDPLLRSLHTAGTSLQELSTGLHQQVISVRRRLGSVLSVVGAVMEWFLQRQGPRDK
ncbi:hypothetical protein JIR001_24690 [Polycladomyces abyssicola]|uniref:DUF948 domain-containing protein n=1 Tax=Polycladomyces abyssicola TaxID=1125966 RepID=A0A8D5UHR9_9BACL|nr:DUF948 domain-containing protein [Polycladomyces abyssicola]BCU82686.1 hypothetical protein JIR001_24690 [Polycladomyces abyssicola]